MLGFGPIGQFAIGEVGASAETVLLDKWFQRLSEPVRFLPGLRPAAQQFAALADPFPFVSFGWFESLSEPVRALPRSPAALSQFAAFNAQPFVPFGWFEELTIPAVRTLPGLKPALQQFEARPPQLRPTPTTFVALNALETKDVFLAALLSWIRATSAEIGIELANTPTAEIGAGIAPVSGAKVAIFTR